MPSVCADQVGKVTLSLHVAALPPLVTRCVVARLKTATCQTEPVQYCPSGRCKVKVVLFALRPTPPLLSATLPLKVAGTVAARKVLPSAGVATEAVAGAVLSSVKLLARPVKPLPAISV